MKKTIYQFTKVGLLILILSLSFFSLHAQGDGP